MIPVIVIRPLPGCTGTVAALRAAGLDARAFPLFAVRPLAWDAPSPASFDALLIGSANAVRHGGAAIAHYAGKPTYAVGESTARVAREAGFEVIVTGSGGLQALLADVRPSDRTLLRLSGRERVDLEAPPGHTIVERTVYASEPLPIPDALAELLRQPAVALLHSGEAARHFAAECSRLGLGRNRLTLAAIGERVAAAAVDGWAAVGVASRPDDKALLALAAELCQTSARS